ncbi:MAG: hypothetical protein AAF626_12065 [Pseudomonadota bacterium]
MSRRALVFAAAVTAASLANTARADGPCPDGSAAPDRAFSQATFEDRGWGPRTAQAAKLLSEGDRSVLIAALEEAPGAVVATIACSNNDLFWALLSNVGFLEPATDRLDADLRATSPVVGYAVTEQGFRALPLLLPGLFEGS